MIDGEGHALITDFGLAKEGIFEKKLTNTVLGGGQSYLIPEVLQNLPYDKSVDLYLFGLLAYEIMVGKATYPCNEDEEVLKQKVLKTQYEMPTDLSDAACDLFKKCIVADRSKRPQVNKLKQHPFFAGIDFSLVE